MTNILAKHLSSLGSAWCWHQN